MYSQISLKSLLNLNPHNAKSDGVAINGTADEAKLSMQMLNSEIILVTRI